MSEKSVLDSFIDCDNITIEAAQELLIMAQRKRFLEKYSWPTGPDSKGYYSINVKDELTKSGRRKLYGRTLEELQDKVYAWESKTNLSMKKTFAEVFDVVCKNKLDSAKGERLYSVQNTINRDKSEYRRFFGGTQFEKLNIDIITSDDIDMIIRQNLKRFDLRRKSFQSLLAILRNTFQYAYRKHYIVKNPYEYIEPKDYSKMLIEDVDIAERVHSDEEVVQILDYIRMYQQKHPSYIGAYALELQILIGARRGEIPPLCWSDVSPQYIRIHREQLTVKKTQTKPEHFVIVSHTKNRQNRNIVRFAELNDFLDKLWRVHETYYPDSNFLFAADTPEGCITNNVIYNFYRRTCKKLGIAVCAETKKGPHSFRRNAYTSYLAASGGDYRGAQLIFGTSCVRNYDTGALDAAETSRLLSVRFDQ